MKRSTNALGGACTASTYRRASGPEGRDPLRIVILYNEAEAGRNAMQQLRKVMDRLGEDFDFKVNLWRLHLATDPTDARTVATAATHLTEADLVLLAVDDRGGLDSKVCSRLRETIHQMRGRGTAVAIMTNCEPSQSQSQFDFLHQAAEEAGVEVVFPSTCNVPAGTSNDSADTNARAAATTQTQTQSLGGILNRPPASPHWGINE